MTKLKFTVLVDEVFNEFDCKLLGMEYSDDGICKVNYATDLRIAFTEGVKEVLTAKPDTIDPKKYNAVGREKVKEYVLGRIKVVGSEGRA